MEKTIVRHSNAGSSRVLKDRAGHVAHSGIATPPRHVHAIGDSGRRRAGELIVPKNSKVLLDMMSDNNANCPAWRRAAVDHAPPANLCNIAALQRKSSAHTGL
jgi:hypothetical protein